MHQKPKNCDIKFMLLVNVSFRPSAGFFARRFFSWVMKMCQRHLQYVTNPSEHVRESTHRNKSAPKTNDKISQNLSASALTSEEKKSQDINAKFFLFHRKKVIY